jgi:hypothetical protein
MHLCEDTKSFHYKVFRNCYNYTSCLCAATTITTRPAN